MNKEETENTNIRRHKNHSKLDAGEHYHSKSLILLNGLKLRKRKNLEVGVRRKVMCGTWVSVSNVLMRPAWSFRVNPGEKQILDKAPQCCTDNTAQEVRWC